MGVYEMNTEPYFQDVRRSAERETYDDGLMEIVIGVLLFIVALATGRPAFMVSKAAWSAIPEGNSSFPPKPPPVAAWMIRTDSGGRPSACSNASTM